MLQRTVHGNGVVTYQSPLLAGVVHGFSTREGGVSEGAFGKLNLGNPAGEGLKDEAANIEENYRRLAAALWVETLPRAWVKQVHGGIVELIEPEGASEYGETVEAEVADRFSGQMSADGMVAAVGGVLLTVRVADCAAILLASRDGRVVAAVHAGWRGVVGNIVGKAVRVMHEAGGMGARPGELCAAIGPMISAEHFEVGEEVAAEFEGRGLAAAVRRDMGPKPHVDLQGAIRMQLETAGVREIDGNELCTFRDAGEFYSHRRDHGVTGRMAAVIGVRM